MGDPRDGIPMAGSTEHLAVRLLTAIRLLYPDEMTPTAKRMLESVIEEETSG